MEELLSYCGYRCDQCPGYHGNIESDEDRKRVQADWVKYYDHKVEVEEVDCRGCKAGLRDGNPNCKVRPCAIEKGVATCAECGDFACETIQKQMDAIKPIAEKHRDSMPVDDIRRYIAPYESEGRLRNLRSE
jgi:5-methylcytosine-specific restriction endonuclease McrA